MAMQYCSAPLVSPPRNLHVTRGVPSPSFGGTDFLRRRKRPTTITAAVSGTLEQAADYSHTRHVLMVADIDPTTVKLLIGISGPILSASMFLFIARIVMSWYPKLPVDRFPFVIAYAPTEPILNATRKVIPPVGGVDITPIVWFGLLSLLNEILLGRQGLLILLSQYVK